MKIWQAAGCAIVSLIALIGLIVGVVFWATGGITDAADEFFAAANEDNYAKAYSLTSQQLQGQVDQEGLVAFLVDNSLDQIVETSWSSRSINNDRGELTGTVTTQSGGAIPITMTLVSEGESWKIVFIDVDNAGLQSSGSEGENGTQPVVEAMVIPSAEGQQDLIISATTGFYNALGDPDFSEFQSRWAEGVTAEQIEETFGSFRANRDALSTLPVSDPQFEPATSLNGAGNLVLNGTYDLPAGEFVFTYEFTGEGDGPTQLVFMDAILN